MPWKECKMVDLREEFVRYALLSDSNISELCRRFSISRKTGYKWLSRYQSEGNEGLCDRSKRPHHSPTRSNENIESLVIATRKQFPYWGGRKLRAYLEQQGHIDLPTASTISKILSRNGLLEASDTKQHAFGRFEHEAPNRLWQMDFKGHFAMEQGRCHPLTILDDHSRFSLCLHACSNEKGETVIPIMEEVFATYGLPACINMDNGAPWGSSISRKIYTRFAVWLMDLGIRVSHSRPYHPQTNGKDERFHRTLNQELIMRTHFRDIPHAQALFDEWRHQYNTIRPHEAIGMHPPIQRYQPSYRSYKGPITSFDYQEGMEVRQADICGRIHYLGKRYKIGRAFAYKQIGVLPKDNDTIQCFYKNTKLSEIDLKKDIT